MNTEIRRNAFHLVCKDVIVEAIKKSQNELKMLGTTAFEFPWKKNNYELYRLMYEKYCQGNYEITIVAESDPTLYSDALLSGLRRDGAGVPIATLTEARQNSTSKLRNYFLEKNSEITGLNPVEDSNRKKLDALYTVEFAKNICKELHARGYTFDCIFGQLEDNDSEQNNGILADLRKNCIEKAKGTFEESNIFHHYLNKRNYYSISKASTRYEESIAESLNKKLEAVLNHNDENLPDQLFEFASKTFSFNYIDPESKMTCEFSLAPKEIQNMCLNCILKYLEDKEPRDYDLIREYASKEAYAERAEQLKKYETDPTTKQRFTLKQIFHPIPVQMLKIDGVYYATVSLLPTFDAKEYLYVGNENLLAEEDWNRFEKYDEYVHYFDVYMNSSYCTEETSKGNKKEVIYNYSFDHAVIGQMPRDSFYGSDNYKLVMWALVFDRKGRILIHRRSNNAKDNQGMWDKSVGGHIAIKDRDTIAGASREIAEELYTVEEEEQGHTKKNGWSSVNENKIIYLGKWNETRYPNFGSNLHLESDEFYSFSFESRMTEQPIDSMRVLPNGTRIKAKCFVDLYFVITSEEFDLSELKNSKYLVMPPNMIKECAKMRLINTEMENRIRAENPEIDEIPKHFDVTPDLEYIINSPEWGNEITKFSIRVKEAFADKQ